MRDCFQSSISSCFYSINTRTGSVFQRKAQVIIPSRSFRSRYVQLAYVCLRRQRNCFYACKSFGGKAANLVYQSHERFVLILHTASQRLCQNYACAIKRSRRLRRLTFNSFKFVLRERGCEKKRINCLSDRGIRPLRYSARIRLFK